jgi:predicted methyltransferase
MDNEVETILRQGVLEMERRFIEYAKNSFEQQHEIHNSFVSSDCLLRYVVRVRIRGSQLSKNSVRQRYT